MLMALFAGCATYEDTRPIVRLSEYDGIVVQNFTSVDPSLGSDFADNIAMELERLGVGPTVLREGLGENEVLVTGAITNYREGDVAQRLKSGNGLGEARVSVSVRVVDSDSGRALASYVVKDTTLQTSPDASRTGRESSKWLLDEVAEQVARKVANR